MLRFSRNVCAIATILAAVALPGADDEWARFGVPLIIAGLLGWLLFDQEVRREMSSHDD